MSRARAGSVATQLGAASQSDLTEDANPAKGMHADHRDWLWRQRPMRADLRGAWSERAQIPREAITTAPATAGLESRDRSETAHLLGGPESATHESSATRSIYIYGGLGAKPEVLQRTIACLRAIPHCKIAVVTVITEKVLAYCDMFVMPGGDARMLQESIGATGAHLLKQYISRGGRYFGICAGMYLLCEEYHGDPSKGGRIEPWPNSLRLLPRMRYPKTTKGSIVYVESDIPNQEWHCYRYGPNGFVKPAEADEGPFKELFPGYKPAPNSDLEQAGWKILATSDDVPIRMRKGNVMVTATHPEEPGAMHVEYFTELLGIAAPKTAATASPSYQSTPALQY